jgi:hypothetical protein
MIRVEGLDIQVHPGYLVTKVPSSSLINRRRKLIQAWSMFEDSTAAG